MEPHGESSVHPRADRTLRGIARIRPQAQESTLLEVPFSFSPGDVEGRATGSAVSLGAEWTRRARGSSVGAARRVPGRRRRTRRHDQRRGTGHGVHGVPGPAAVGSQPRLARAAALLVNGALQDAARSAARDVQDAGRRTLQRARLSRESVRARQRRCAASIEYQFPPLVDDAGRRARSSSISPSSPTTVCRRTRTSALPTASKARICERRVSACSGTRCRLPRRGVLGRGLSSEQNTATESLQDKGFHYRLSASTEGSSAPERA